MRCHCCSSVIVVLKLTAGKAPLFGCTGLQGRVKSSVVQRLCLAVLNESCWLRACTGLTQFISD